MATKNYTLGRGNIYFARFTEGEVPGPFRFVGNTPEISLTVETEDLEHTSSDAGVNQVDDRVALSVTRTGTMVMDDIQDENLALFFFGSRSMETTASGDASGSPEDFTGVNVDDVLQLGLSDTNRVGVRNVSVTSVALTDDPAGDRAPVAALTEGTNYSVDAMNGFVTILDNATNVALFAGGRTARVTYTVAAGSYSRVTSGTTPVEGAMRFVEDNPKGNNNQWIFPKVTVTPNGDMALKSDEWRTVPFSLAISQPSSGEAIYINGVPA